MAGINVNGIGRNPYADSYLTSAKNRSNTTSKDTFVNAVKKVEESKNSADTSNVMYPGDVTIDYPPRINNAVNNSVVSEKSKDEMSLDEYKQWVMNQISQFPVSGWVRSTFSSGSIVIKEEAFERMKNDPEYENYVLNRVRSAYSVQGLPVGSNNVTIIDGNTITSSVDGVDINAGYFVTKSNSQGVKTVIYYATFDMGENTIYVEYSGVENESETVKNNLADTILKLIENGAFDLSQIQE